MSVLVLDDEHNIRWFGTAAAYYPEWDPDHTWVQYDLTGEGGVDLMAGDHVWMYDGIN
ncbi:MAG: hypothetical protein GTN93_13315, partial [Anaerolineae bacterium]|nr:hypothetical protein [Anaerolineae bacterium]